MTPPGAKNDPPPPDTRVAGGKSADEKESEELARRLAAWERAALDSGSADDRAHKGKAGDELRKEPSAKSLVKRPPRSGKDSLSIKARKAAKQMLRNLTSGADVTVLTNPGQSRRKNRNILALTSCVSGFTSCSISGLISGWHGNGYIRRAANWRDDINRHWNSLLLKARPK